MRDRFNAFVVRHDVAWELGMAGLALLYVAIGFVNDQQDSAAFDAIEWALTGLFVLEFGGRLLASRDRVQYLRGHWVDAVTLAPPVRGFRVLRLLRLLRLVRSFAGVYRATMHVQEIARHRGFAWLLVGAGIARQLADLAALRGEGSLTEDEFALAKAQVLRSVGH